MKMGLAAVMTWFAVAVMLLGCPRRKAEADAGPDVATADVDSGTATGAEPAAVNANEVARFGDENKLAEDAAQLASNATARLAPPNGQLVASLPKGAAVTKIAEHEGFVLVAFADPKNNAQQLEGWVPAATVGVASTATGGGGGGGTGTGGGGGTGTGHAKKDGGADGGTVAVAVADAGAATTPTATPPPAVTCPAGTVALINKACAKKCNVPTDCVGGKTCLQSPVLAPVGTFAKVCLPP